MHGEHQTVLESVVDVVTLNHGQTFVHVARFWQILSALLRQEDSSQQDKTCQYNLEYDGGWWAESGNRGRTGCRDGCHSLEDHENCAEALRGHSHFCNQEERVSHSCGSKTAKQDERVDHQGRSLCVCADEEEK